jgi:hypothetical protein
MTDAQYHAEQIRALRTGRRYLRSYQTQLEVVERIMDRLITNKRPLRPDSYTKFADEFRKVQTQWSPLQKAMADSIVQY